MAIFNFELKARKFKLQSLLGGVPLVYYPEGTQNSYVDEHDVIHEEPVRGVGPYEPIVVDTTLPAEDETRYNTPAEGTVFTVVCENIRQIRTLTQCINLRYVVEVK